MSSLMTRLATRRGFLAASAAVSNRSAKARVAVRVAASWSLSAVFGDHAGAAGLGQLGQRGARLRPGRPAIDDERRQVGLGEVAVVVGLLLGAHGVGAAFAGVPEARLLDDAAAGLDDLDLALDLVLEGGADEAEGVDVFDLDLGAELLLAAGTDGDVGVAAERAFFHVAVGDAGVEEDLLEAGEVLVGLVGGADVGLGDDLDQRRAAAVEVDVGARGGVGEAVVEALAGVLFHVQAGDADALVLPFGASGTSIQPCSARGLSNWRDLVALGQIGIEVVFAGEDGAFADLAVEGERGQDGELDGLLVEDGQGSGQAEADGADVGVGLGAEAVGAAAEGLGLGEELDVDFESDDGFVLGENVGRKADRGAHSVS